MMRIGKQVSEAMRLHTDLPRSQIRERVVELLAQVHLPDPEGLVRRYPHQLSGGQQQRVLIAMAIACDPQLLIADEPTTALDVTVQNGILALLRELSAERGMGLLFISHDLGVVQSINERFALVYGGNLVETGPTDAVIADPHHRYTEALLSVNPGIATGEGLAAALNQELGVIPGSVPALGRFPAGCRFRGRCGHETAQCAEPPAVTFIPPDRTLKCWNPAGTTASTARMIDVCG
jgi:peptide/nickel transport system ATP-binding protein